MIRNALSESLKEAMRSKDKVAISTLRLVLAALKDRDIAARVDSESTDLGDGEILSMLETMVKQRRESIKMYDKGGRPELAEQERAEIAIIEQFLPKQLDDEEIESAVVAAIAEVEADSLKQMGKVMARLRETYAGQMDFGKAGAIAKQQQFLSSLIVDHDCEHAIDMVDEVDAPLQIGIEDDFSVSVRTELMPKGFKLRFQYVKSIDFAVKHKPHVVTH